MQRAIQISTLALLLALGGCGREQEETPDITEAIPLEPAEGMGAGEDAANGSEGSANGGANGGQGQAGSSGPSQDRAIPDTMETGRNPPNMTEPPAGSKVQKFN